jgi:hypothetical protein
LSSIVQGLTGIDLGSLGLRSIPKLEARKKKNGTATATGAAVSQLALFQSICARARLFTSLDLPLHSRYHYINNSTGRDERKGSKSRKSPLHAFISFANDYKAAKAAAKAAKAAAAASGAAAAAPAASTAATAVKAGKAVSRLVFTVCSSILMHHLGKGSKGPSHKSELTTKLLQHTHISQGAKASASTAAAVGDSFILLNDSGDLQIQASDVNAAASDGSGGIAAAVSFRLPALVLSHPQ